MKNYLATIRWPVLSGKFPWTVIYFIPLLYFTLFDQAAFIPSVRNFSVVLVVLILAPWLLLKIKRPASWPATPLDYLLGLVLLVQFISALFSPSFRLTLYNLWLLLLSILCFYFMLDRLRAGRENFLWPAFLLVVTWVLGLAVLEFLIWYLGLVPLLGFEVSWPAVAGWTLPPQPRRLGLAFLTVPVAPPFSAYVGLFILLALGLALSTRRLSTRLALSGFILLSLLVLLFTFSRAGLVTLGAGLVTLVWLAWLGRRHSGPSLTPTARTISIRLADWGQSWRTKWFIPITALLMFLFLILLAWNWRYFTNEVFENRAGSNQIRLALLQAAIRMWQDYPLLGLGPGLFGEFYRNYIPPNSFFLLYLSAHSLYFQLLAEAGLAGIVLAMLIALNGSTASYQRLRQPKPSPQQWRLIGAVSAVVGYFVTAAIEQLWWLPFLIPLGLIAAYPFYQPGDVAAASGPKVGPEPQRPRWLPLFYLILLTASGAAWLWLNSVADRLATLTENVKPGQELAIAEELGRLQKLDPGLPLYTIGQAYYLGRHVINTLAVAPCSQPPSTIPEPEQAVLEQSIRLYEAGLQPLKAHPIYWANLASLYWLNHQPEAAQAALTQARNLSNTEDATNDLFRLNSGCYYELQGQTEAAVSAYSQLLHHQPQLLSSGFWQGSAFRAAQLPQIMQLALGRAPDQLSRLLLAIEFELARQNIPKTEKLIAELSQAYPDSPQAKRYQAQKLLRQRQIPPSLDLAQQLQDYQLLGEIALASGDTDSAQLNFKKALFINPGSVESRWQLAHLALAQGNTAEAIAQLKHLTAPYPWPDTNDSRFIYGYSANWPLYNSLLVVAAPPLQGQAFDLLARLYQDTGQPDLARAVYQALTTYDPYLKN
jgi:Tfp pilus assembly protein PilF/O-antigen ligase